MSQEIKVKCENCEHEFFLNVVGIQEEEVVLKDGAYMLQYFSCPSCKKIYRICLKDNRYCQLSEELASARRRIRRQWGKLDAHLQQTLNNDAIFRHNLLKAYVDEVNRKHPGVFEFGESADGEKHIIYRE